MLGFIAENYDQALTINDVASTSNLTPTMQWGYSSGSCNCDETVHYRDAHQPRSRVTERSDKSILDIALTAGFRSSSRFTARSANMSACRRNNTANLAKAPPDVSRLKTISVSAKKIVCRR